LYQRYKNDGLTIVAVDMGEPVEKVKSFVDQHRLSFPHVLDQEAKVAGIFSIRATPTNFLIGRDGRILGGGAGYRDWSTPEAHQLIQSLLVRKGTQ
jgi:peroxiredoxin